MKRLGLAIVALASTIATAAPIFVQPASAQEMPEWWDGANSWERPRRFRPPPPEYRRPPEAADVYRDDDGWHERWHERRRARRWWREDHVYRDRDRDRDDDGDWREEQRARNAPQPDQRRYRNLDEDDENGQQWPAEEGDPNSTAGVSGGAQPNIAAVAPPQIRFSAGYAPGSIVIDTSARKLYYVTSTTSAYAYPIGVGREGFAWTGAEKVSRVQDWPDWYPPAEMRKRKPELPERMLGGLNNPLGAKAIYLGNTLYRIHGTNDPKSIGKAESSGCFRMLNQNVLHLAELVKVGTPVTVVKELPRGVATAAPVVQSQSQQARPAPQRRRPSWWD